jgi:hypothetical protein
MSPPSMYIYEDMHGCNKLQVYLHQVYSQLYENITTSFSAPKYY